MIKRLEINVYAHDLCLAHSPVTSARVAILNGFWMMLRRILYCLTLVLAGVLASRSGLAAELPAHLEQEIGKQVAPAMAQYRIPGLAIAVCIGGKDAVLTFGVLSRETGQPVTDGTLFELGSVSKTFLATLTALADIHGKLKLSDPVGRHLGGFSETRFGNVSLLHLATHTTGGLPLQLPDDIENDEELADYLRGWTPAGPEGLVRTYSNVSIGMLGRVAAQSLGSDYKTLVQDMLFPSLGLHQTYINVPAEKMAQYAQGYSKDDEPVRIQARLLSTEAYGVKSTPRDMLRFLETELHPDMLSDDLRRAVLATRTGYFNVGPMTQDLVWEQFPYPVDLPRLLDGVSDRIVYGTVAVTPITPPQLPRDDSYIHKTGGTGGFSTYLAFIPIKGFALAILANKNFPVVERVKLASRILAIADANPRP